MWVGNQYLYTPWFKSYILTLGKCYKIKFTATGKEVIGKFIKTSPKGFNLLDVKSSKCILNQRLYSKRWAGMDIDPTVEKFSICINAHFIESIVEYKKEEDLNAYEN